MEIIDASEQAKHHHHWLEWLGLEEPPATADQWVPVVNGIAIDDPVTRTSTVAARLVDEMGAAGIEAHPRLYQFYEVVPGRQLPRTGLASAIAVAVHNRDLTRAVPVAVALQAQLAQEPARIQVPPGLSNEELTRQALEAGPPPPD